MEVREKVNNAAKPNKQKNNAGVQGRKKWGCKKKRKEEGVVAVKEGVRMVTQSMQPPFFFFFSRKP